MTLKGKEIEKRTLGGKSFTNYFQNPLSILHRVYSTKCTPPSYSAKCTPPSVLHLAYSTKYTPPNVRHRVYSNESTLPSVLHQVYSTECIPPSILHGVYSTKCTPPSVLHQVYSIEYCTRATILKQTSPVPERPSQSNYLKAIV